MFLIPPSNAGQSDARTNRVQSEGTDGRRVERHCLDASVELEPRQDGPRKDGTAGNADDDARIGHVEVAIGRARRPDTPSAVQNRHRRSSMLDARRIERNDLVDP